MKWDFFVSWCIIQESSQFINQVLCCINSFSFFLSERIWLLNIWCVNLIWIWFIKFFLLIWMDLRWFQYVSCKLILMKLIAIRGPEWNGTSIFQLNPEMNFWQFIATQLEFRIECNIQRTALISHPNNYGLWYFIHNYSILNTGIWIQNWNVHHHRITQIHMILQFICISVFGILDLDPWLLHWAIIHNL